MNSAFKEYIFFNGKRIARRDSTNAVNYYFADHLGTARIVANSSGTVLDDSDFYPFGGERVISSSSGNSYKFTGKERDGESGLDNFGARYDSSSLGRFTSPDPKQIGAHLLDPQTLNRYAYTRNNPLLYIDPDGKDLAKAWAEVKTFVSSIYIKVSGGGGPGAKGKAGPFHSEAGVMGKYTAKTSLGDDGKLVTISKSVEVGASVEAGSFKAGRSIAVEQAIATVNTNLTIDTKPGIPTVTQTGSAGSGDAYASSSSDEKGIGVEIGVFLKAGAEVGATQEGLNALKDSVSEVKDSVTNPGPPPAPKPPQPPPCSADKDKKCN